jgi:hypothetical protein
LRVGSGASAYYSITVTANHEGSFTTGWNLLRFDFANKATTGSPDSDAGTYVALYMTKAVGKTDDGYRFDNIVMRGGVIHDLYYYSKYGWQTAAGVWIENSTDNGDFVNADTDELELFTYAGKAEAALELRHFNLNEIWEKRYQNKKAEYQLKYPSEAKLLTQIYYDL